MRAGAVRGGGWRVRSSSRASVRGSCFEGLQATVHTTAVTPRLRLLATPLSFANAPSYSPVQPGAEGSPLVIDRATLRAMPDPRADAKKAAARAAADLVPHGCKLGLGTGSTIAFLLDRLAERQAEGLEFIGVPTSEATARRGRELGLPIGSLEDVPDGLDLAIDGADEVDPNHELIKGGGGALTREKIVAFAARSFVVVVSSDKLVEKLGDTFRLPIEVLEFGVGQTIRQVAAVTGTDDITVRKADDLRPRRTDNGGLLLDAVLPPAISTDPTELRRAATALVEIPGVVEHGLFLGHTDRVLVGHDDGSVIG